MELRFYYYHHQYFSYPFPQSLHLHCHLHFPTPFFRKDKARGRWVGKGAPFLLIVEHHGVRQREHKLWDAKDMLLNPASPLTSCETVSSLLNLLEAHSQVL